MKAPWLIVICATLVSGAALAQDSLSLVGTWTGERERIRKADGWAKGPVTLVVTEQKGNTFSGRLKRANPSGDEEEPFWAAFTPGGNLMVGSDEEGVYIFDLVDLDTLDYCYTESGGSARSTCARLYRQR